MSSTYVLVVDDDKLDVRLVRRAYKSAGLDRRIEAASSGSEALDVLSRPRPERPDLVLLDLRMPGMTGHELLRELKARDDLRTTPIVILTTSDDPRDLREAFDTGAAGYFVKPMEFAEFVELVKTIDGYWNRCALP